MSPCCLTLSFSSLILFLDSVVACSTNRYSINNCGVPTLSCYDFLARRECIRNEDVPASLNFQKQSSVVAIEGDIQEKKNEGGKKRTWVSLAIVAVISICSFLVLST